MASESYEQRWKILEELGEGGQGKVYRVLDKKKVQSPEEIGQSMSQTIRELFAGKDAAFEKFRHSILDTIAAESPENHGALKILHSPDEARDPERADERIKREIEAMSRVSHPNLLKILDRVSGHQWYVSEFHLRGALSGCLGMFQGDLAAAVNAIRPLVEGVAELHSQGIVHRDIKPHNVFIASDGRLVLGDFGLVYFEDDAHTRLSATLENVGSRDWMPEWATGMRIEDVKPTFDVFSLGKLLWAMVSGESFLRLWYFDRPEFDVQKQFPDAPHIDHANPLFAKCIVEEKDNCLPNAGELLKAIDRTIAKITSGVPIAAAWSSCPATPAASANTGLAAGQVRDASRRPFPRECFSAVGRGVRRGEVRSAH